MQFLQLTAALSALASMAAAQSTSAQQVVSNNAQLLSTSNATDTTTKSVTLVNGFQTGPEVIRGYHQLFKQLSADDQALTGKSNTERDVASGSLAGRATVEARATTYSAADQTSVCNSYSPFLKNLNTAVTDAGTKHGILEATGVAYQMAAVLRGVEAAVDQYSIDITGFTPTCSASFQSSQKTLDATLAKIIDQYANGLP